MLVISGIGLPWHCCRPSRENRDFKRKLAVVVAILGAPSNVRKRTLYDSKPARAAVADAAIVLRGVPDSPPQSQTARNGWCSHVAKSDTRGERTAANTRKRCAAPTDVRRCFPPQQRLHNVRGVSDCAPVHTRLAATSLGSSLIPMGAVPPVSPPKYVRRVTVSTVQVAGRDGRDDMRDVLQGSIGQVQVMAPQDACCLARLLTHPRIPQGILAPGHQSLPSTATDSICTSSCMALPTSYPWAALTIHKMLCSGTTVPTHQTHAMALPTSYPTWLLRTHLQYRYQTHLTFACPCARSY